MNFSSVSSSFFPIDFSHHLFAYSAGERENARKLTPATEFPKGSFLPVRQAGKKFPKSCLAVNYKGFRRSAEAVVLEDKPVRSSAASTVLRYTPLPLASGGCCTPVQAHPLTSGSRCTPVHARPLTGERHQYWSANPIKMAPFIHFNNKTFQNPKF